MTIWTKIFEHPFVIELYRGDLVLDRFRYYIVQDYNYLLGLMRACALAATKADYRTARMALEIAYRDATIEMEAYVKLLEKLELSLDEVVNTEPSPTNVAYVNFLISTCALGTALECLVSILPCFWSYMEIADRHKHLLKHNRSKLYVSWAQTYLSTEYRELVKNLIDTVDSLWNGNSYIGLRRIFITASRYEWLFWDSAYKMEKWPI